MTDSKAIAHREDILRMVAETMTVTEVARLLDVSEQTVRNYANAGELPHMRRPSRRSERFFFVADVARFIEAREERKRLEAAAVDAYRAAFDGRRPHRRVAEPDQGRVEKMRGLEPLRCLPAPRLRLLETARQI